LVWGKKLEVVVKAFDSEWQDVHGDKTQNICEKVCLWIGCGLEEQELLEICCNLEVYDLEETKGPIAKLMVFFFGGCLRVKLVGKRLKNAKQRAKYVCMSSSYVFFCVLFM
jgi:hypothetical protein